LLFVRTKGPICYNINPSDYGPTNLLSHLDYNLELYLPFTVTIANPMYCPPNPASLQYYCKVWLYKESIELSLYSISHNSTLYF